MRVRRRNDDPNYRPPATRYAVGYGGYGESSEYTGEVPKKFLSSTFAPYTRALCICSGCSPFAMDDGRRPRNVILTGVWGFSTNFKIPKRKVKVK